MCLVQKKEGEGREEFLFKYMFGSGGDGRDFIINLQFYPYNKNMFHSKIKIALFKYIGALLCLLMCALL
jgi:hypothetical protein